MESRNLQPVVSRRHQSGKVMRVTLLAILGLLIAAVVVKNRLARNANDTIALQAMEKSGNDREAARTRDDPKVFGGGAPGR